MKRFIYLCLLLAPLCGAQAQQSAPASASPASNDSWGTTPAKSSNDDWGTPAKTEPAAAPADKSLTNTGTADPNAAPADGSQPADPSQPVAAPDGGGLGDMIAADTKPAAEPVAMKIKPAPKLNPNSAGTYNKKAVQKQHKITEKAAEKRLRQTHRYQAVREYGKISGIRRMQKGKIPHGGNQRMR